MIPATDVTPVVDGTMWLRLDDTARFNQAEEWWMQADRPCDTCGGAGRRQVDRYGNAWGDKLAEAMSTVIVGDIACPDCDGTGRHTFTMDVAYITRADLCPHDRCGSLRVHVIPDMVLPIYADVGPVPTETHIRITGGGIAWLAEPIQGGGWRHTEITLPSAAKPGDWLVQLEVHE